VVIKKYKKRQSTFLMMVSWSDKLLQLPDKLLEVESLAREAVSDVQLSLAKGKKDKYANYSPVLVASRALSSSITLIDMLHRLRDIAKQLGPRGHGLEELGRAVERVKGELEKLDTELATLKESRFMQYRYLPARRDSYKLAVAECELTSEREPISCTGELGAEEVAERVATLAERILSLEPVKLLESRGKEIFESVSIESIACLPDDEHCQAFKNATYSLSQALEKIQNMREALSMVRRAPPLEWAPYSDALKLVRATEGLYQQLVEMCIAGRSVKGMVMGVENAEKRLAGVVKALEAACDLDDLALATAVFEPAIGDWWREEGLTGERKQRRGLVVVSTSVRVAKKHLDAFRRAREALGRPIGWFIPNAREGEELKPTAVVNDLANYVHVVAEEIKKLMASTAGNCILEQDTEPLLAKVCLSWSEAVSEGFSKGDYHSEDKSVLIGYTSGKKLYLRVGSAPGHATVIEKLNGKARVEYYDSDEPVREVMMSLLEDIVGCECDDKPESEKSVCSCPLETEEDAVKLGAVISRATSMDYRLGDIARKFISEYEEEMGGPLDEEQEATVMEWALGEAVDPLYHKEERVVKRIIKSISHSK
jgi:tetratricopeptide (TPR) repeat protein